MDDLGITGITIEGQVDVEPGEEESVYKFNAKLADNEYIDNNDAHLIGSLFEEVSGVSVNDESVMVSITSAETGELAGLYTANAADWTQGTITFKEGFEGLVKITIQDYQFCKPTTIYVNVIEILPEILNFNQETGNTNMGKIDFAEFLTKEIVF